MAICANLSDSVGEIAAKNERLLLNLAKVLRLFFRVLQVYVGIILVAVAYLLASPQENAGALVQFLEWGVIFASYCAISLEFSVLFREASAGRCFSRRGVRSLRIASIAFLLLFVIASAFSLIAANMAADGFRGWGITYPLGGFPSPQVWTSIFDGNSPIYPSGNAAIDPSNLFFALILWGLSFVFQYGAYLQEEKDLVI